MNRLKLFALTVVFLFASPLYAQYVPVIAKIKETKEVFVNGQKTESQTREGTYYRRSDGSTLEEWTTVTGGRNLLTGNLMDNTAGLMYQLNLTDHVAIQRPRRMPPGASSLAGPPQSPEPTNPSTPREVVGGVSCFVAPVKSPAGQSVTTTGEICFSGQYHLELRSDITDTVNQTSRTQHTVREMSDVQLNKEPDPKLFDLKGRGFTIFRPEAPTPSNP